MTKLEIKSDPSKVIGALSRTWAPRAENELCGGERTQADVLVRKQTRTSAARRAVERALREASAPCFGYCCNE